MATLNRRDLFGFASVTALGAALADRSTDPNGESVKPFRVEDRIVEAARVFAEHTLPKVPGHFVCGINQDENTATGFDYSGSGWCFSMNSNVVLTRLINDCVAHGSIPDFGVMGQREWNVLLDVIFDLMRDGNHGSGVEAVERRQHRDIRCRYLWWDGVPFFWCGYMEEHAMNSVYIVNVESLNETPRPGVKRNGIILNADKS